MRARSGGTPLARTLTLTQTLSLTLTLTLTLTLAQTPTLTRYKQENQDLTEEYKRITEQFKDLQNKFQHFEVADTNRYRDVWQMNEEAITELMRKARLRAAPARRALGAAIRVAPPP